MPEFDEEIWRPWSSIEKKTLIIIGITFVLWLTKGLHGIDYSVTGMLGVAALVLFSVSGMGRYQRQPGMGNGPVYFRRRYFPGSGHGIFRGSRLFCQSLLPADSGEGWLVLFIGVAVFGALVTNAMANVAAAALILPIVIPMAQLEGVNPTILALCLGMATSFAMLLVIGCPPNAIAYSYRYFKASDLTKVGLVATPVLLAFWFWWRPSGGRFWGWYENS